MLERNINTHYYERLLTSPDKRAALEVTGTFENHQLGDFIKDPYVLEFLGIPESPSVLERDIEQAIVSNLQKFLLEMGKGFAFITSGGHASTVISTEWKNLLLQLRFLTCVRNDSMGGRMTGFQAVLEMRGRGQWIKPTTFTC